MAYPIKFKDLLELELDDLEKPSYLWLTYAVCGCDSDACGWAGWIIDSVFSESEEHHNTVTGDKIISSADSSQCPKCGKELFRTAASIRFEPSINQEPIYGEPGVDYEVTPLEYE